MTVYVYRLFTRSGDLLYVGASSDISQRLRKHQQRWGTRIARVDMTVHQSWDEARIVERDTILQQQPIANSNDNGKPRRTGWGELEGIVLTTLQQLGPLTSSECAKAVIARGYDGPAGSVSNTIKRLVEKGSVRKVGDRPAQSGRYKTAAVFDAYVRARKPQRRRVTERVPFI